VISVHSKNASSNEIIAYLDDLVTGLHGRSNFFETMNSIEWRAKILFENNPKTFVAALESWSLHGDRFKVEAANHLNKKFETGLSND
jgi:hypothetical protein